MRKRLSRITAMILVLGLAICNPWSSVSVIADESETAIEVATDGDATQEIQIATLDDAEEVVSEEKVAEVVESVGEESTEIADEAAEETAEELNYPAFEQSVIVDGVNVTVAAAEGIFPENSTLSVTKVSGNNKALADLAVDAVRDENVNVVESYTFDIKVFDAFGEEIQPTDNQSVQVSFAMAEIADTNLHTDVYHIPDEDGNFVAEELSITETGSTVTAITDGFSFYTVEFTYGNLQYVMNGDTTIPLSDILDYIGLTGEVSTVSVSDESLLSVSNESGNWMVTALQAFSTYEWMQVCLEGVDYKIVVTDAKTPVYSEPSVKTDLVYSGDDQALIDGGSVSQGGTMKYALGSDKDIVPVDGWNTSVPTGKKAGTYYVWWRIDSSEGYSGIEASYMEISISQKELTITGGELARKTYDGTRNATISKTPDLSGVVEGDDVSCTYTATLSTSSVGNSCVATIKGTLSGADADNYIVKNRTQYITIYKASLTVKANPNIITYGEAPDNNGVIFEGFVNGENEGNLYGSLKFSYDYSQYDDAGSYTITPTGFSGGNNYLIYYETGKLTVEKKEVGINWSDTELAFNGSLQKPTATVTGTVNGDSLGVEVEGEQSSIGENYTATATALTGEKSGNYKLPENKTTTFSIKSGNMSVESSGYTGTYDGNSHGISVNVSSPSSTTIRYRTKDSGEYDLTDNPTFTKVGTYTVYYQVSKPNFETYTGSEQVKINPKDITITANSKSKVYDGEFLTDNGYIIPSNSLVSGDSVETVTVSGSQKAAGSSENKASGAVIRNSLDEDVTGCYNIKYIDGELKVTQKPITITADSDEKEYDGTVLVDDGYTSDSLAEGDKFETVAVDGFQLFKGSSDNVPSDAKIVDVNGQDVTKNYEITYKNGTLKVTPKPITITADSDSKVYDGKELTKNSYTFDIIEPIVGDEIDSVTITGSQTDVGSSDNVPSEAKIINSDKEDVTDCYDIEYVKGTLEVNKKDITVTTTDKSKTFGQEDPELDYEVEGMVEGESLEGITLSRKTGEDVGEYLISATNDDSKNTNYNIAISNTGKLTIKAKEVKPAFGAPIDIQIHTGEEITPKVVLMDGENEIPESEYTLEYTNNTEVGTATITVKDVAGGNYVLTSVSTTFTIIAPGQVAIVSSEGNACGAELTGTAEEVASAIGLTDEDKEALAEGKNITYFFESKDITDTISGDEKNNIEALLEKDQKAAAYLDICVYKQIDGKEKEQVSKTEWPLEFKFGIPGRFRLQERKFDIFRYHESSWDKVTKRLAGWNIYGLSNLYSTYVLVYSDPQDTAITDDSSADSKETDAKTTTTASKETNAETPANTSKEANVETPATTEKNEKTSLKSPVTRDNVQTGVALIFMMIAVSGIGIVAIFKKKVKMRI